jgi:Na+/melibiose symporter-like transporter
MKEDDVVLKVRELMVTLDHVKKFRELSDSLRWFVLFAGGSIIVYIIVKALLGLFSNVTSQYSYPISVVALVIPFTGVIFGILRIRKRINSITTGEWEQTLSKGFSGSLQLLSELDWQATFDEIRAAKSASLLYGVAKLSCYTLLVFFITSLIAGSANSNPPVTFALLAAVSIAISLTIGGRDMFRRYRDAKSLGFLLEELRSFYDEFKGSEFKITEA